MRLRCTVAVTVAVIALTGSASAGPSRHAWLYGTEVLPERQVEIETWVQEEDGKGDDHADETLWWVAPVVGLTDQVELAIPFEVVSESSDAAPEPRVAFEHYGVELRWRLVTSDPVEAPAVVPLLRVGIKRLPGERDAA